MDTSCMAVLDSATTMRTSVMLCCRCQCVLLGSRCGTIGHRCRRQSHDGPRLQGLSRFHRDTLYCLVYRHETKIKS
ncbi:hypothetical protein DPMN_137481 [Dreissena polymorpha]|uniref:Uncharacterized protein n=1 Tax=Dreissena polymorpha TaxID=45954 RepID=A0A9D4JHP5_DREPO|nr:hypothetical protein DPMN_137481 [Dreissena polymorpha]